MAGRLFLSGFLIFCGVVLDLGLPTWSPRLGLPRCLDFAWIMACLLTPGGWSVCWGGVAGLCDDLVRENPPGTGLMIYATLSLVWACLRNPDGRRLSLLDRAFASLLLLVLLTGCRLATDAILNPEALSRLAPLTAVQSAATFLLCMGGAVLMSLPSARRAAAASRNSW
ncbi:hypothetical protein [Planctomicrobium sp. SH664]|uniref:hypothetical protein n=1 Tax=Planctomicrobium sp. SH664 TaxID=3448125 RepID=UPI003F5BE200